jgi:hypothetical protein
MMIRIVVMIIIFILVAIISLFISIQNDKNYLGKEQ